MNTVSKLKSNGLRFIAEDTIEQHDRTEAMRGAAFALDCKLADDEFRSREAKLRQEFLDAIAEIGPGRLSGFFLSEATKKLGGKERVHCGTIPFLER